MLTATAVQSAQPKPSPARQAPAQSTAANVPDEAVSLHPENPRYFLFRNRPLFLLAATEHYGAVINAAFDFERYLADVADKHQTMTRTFLLFREHQTVRNPSSSLNPVSPDFVAPWPRTGPGRALDGEPRYDLDQWNPEYFRRLHRFVSRASELGIVVELTLFSNAYGNDRWPWNPLRSENNLQGIGKIPWNEYTTLHSQPLVDRQLAFAAKIVQETGRYDNIYYEICNEPGGNVDRRATTADVDAWQEHVAALVRAELARLGKRRLVFGSLAVDWPPKDGQAYDENFSSRMVDAVNLHPLRGMVLAGHEYMLGRPMSKMLDLRNFRDFCRAAQAFAKPCVHDEDNAATMYCNPVGWTIHRKRAWTALLSLCHYDFIDFSITPGSETGTRESNRQIRTWMKHLADFMDTFDYIHARTAQDWIVEKPAHVVESALALPAANYVAYLADDREWMDPTAGEAMSGNVSVRLPAGRYLASFYSPTAGLSSPAISISAGAEPVVLRLAPFVQDVVLRVTREQ